MTAYEKRLTTYVEGKGYRAYRARVEDRYGNRWWLAGSLFDIERSAAAQSVEVVRVEPAWVAVCPAVRVD